MAGDTMTADEAPASRLLAATEDGGRENAFNRDLAEALVQIGREWVKLEPSVLTDPLVNPRPCQRTRGEGPAWSCILRPNRKVLHHGAVAHRRSCFGSSHRPP